METRRRLSSESSSYSFSSGLSYYDYGSSVISDDEEVTDNNRCCTTASSNTHSTKSRTFFDDVKVILSRHDSKLAKLEDDLSFVVGWLNKKFDFILKHESTLSIPSMLEEHYYSNDELSMIEGQSKRTSTPLPPTNSTPMESESILSEEDDEDRQRPVEIDSISERQYISHYEKQQANREHDDDDVDAMNQGAATFTSSPPPSNAKRTSPTVLKSSTRTNEPLETPKTSRSGTKRLRSAPHTLESQRPSQCDTCGKFLKDPSSLRQHKKIHLNIRPFICTEPDCGKSFRRKFHLQTHALIHKGVKNHQCGYCGRCFLLQKDLITHERIHTGEKPYNCPECSKSFALKSHLVMHVRTHTGEKPYKCEVCDKTFTQSNTLRIHKKKVHQETGGVSSGRSKSSKKATGSRKKKATKTKEQATTSHSPLASTPALPLPAKLPIYRNQMTAYKNIPTLSRIAPTVTILQQPIIANQPIELFEPIDSISISSPVFTEFSTLSPSCELNTVSNNSIVPMISSEFVNFPQQIIIPRNNL